jgi:hypothetical protein
VLGVMLKALIYIGMEVKVYEGSIGSKESVWAQ